MDRCNPRGLRTFVTMLAVALMATSVHAELLFDKPAATAADENAVKTSVIDLDGPASSAASTDDDDNGEVLFSKTAPPVIPHRSKDLQCAPLKNPHNWEHALGWRHPDQPLPSWGWERTRWCGDLDRMLDRLVTPINRLARWAACEGATAAGGVATPAIAQLCAARYDPRDWSELRPRLTVYSLGTWSTQDQQCPAAVVEITQLVGALAGSTTHVLVPLEGSCPLWHGFDPMEKNWTTAPVTPALVNEGQQRWAGYDGETPDGWTVAFLPVGQVRAVPPVTGASAVPAAAAASVAVPWPAGVAVQPPIVMSRPRRTGSPITP